MVIKKLQAKGGKTGEKIEQHSLVNRMHLLQCETFVLTQTMMPSLFWPMRNNNGTRVGPIRVNLQRLSMRHNNFLE